VGWRGDHAELTVSPTQLDLLDALVRADPAAYIADRYGPVANPAAPCHLRNLLHQLAELVLERDGSYPAWWRALGEEP
jgi:hypothetical protein